jgi:hypothetical protein
MCVPLLRSPIWSATPAPPYTAVDLERKNGKREQRKSEKENIQGQDNCVTAAPVASIALAPPNSLVVVEFR